MSDEHTLGTATEVMLDALLPLAEGKDDADLIFVDGALRALGDGLGLACDFGEVEPMTAGEFRRRWRTAKAHLASGEAPQ